MWCRTNISWPTDMHPQLRDLLECLLQRDPERRLSWPNLLYHPFIADGNYYVSVYASDDCLCFSPTELDIEYLMQCARGADKLVEKVATPTPVTVWTNYSATVSYHYLTSTTTFSFSTCMVQKELDTLLNVHPPTPSVLTTLHQLLSQQSLMFSVDLARWVVALVTDLPLLGGVALEAGIDILILLTKQLLVSICEGLFTSDLLSLHCINFTYTIGKVGQCPTHQDAITLAHKLCLSLSYNLPSHHVLQVCKWIETFSLYIFIVADFPTLVCTCCWQYQLVT